MTTNNKCFLMYIFYGIFFSTHINIFSTVAPLTHIDEHKYGHKYQPIPLSQLKKISEKSINYLIRAVANPRVRLFLNVLSLVEGTSLKKDLQRGQDPISLDQYKIYFTGKRFDSFDCHPGEIGIKHIGSAEPQGKKISSTAAGRYQFVYKTWSAASCALDADSLCNKKSMISSLTHVFSTINKLYIDGKKIFKKPSDLCRKGKFNPFMQDLFAIYMIHSSNALQDVLNGRIKEALAKTSSTWAALPEDERNMSYYEHHKPSIKFDALIENYLKNLKTIK